MNITLGIILAFVAALFWGFGDFFIQKTTRKMGDWETLFVVTFIGTLLLLPFSFNSLVDLLTSGDLKNILILAGCGIFLFTAAIFNLQGMKLGKISVIEPLWSIEIISASVISYLVLREALSPVQICLIGALIVCFILLSIKESGSFKWRNFFVEKGVVFAVVGTIIMGAADFFMGWGSRVTDPLLVNFAVNIVMSTIAGGYLLFNGRIAHLANDIRHNTWLILRASFLDNFGWIAYAFAMSMAPIGIATSLTEASILVAVMLGLFVNKEKLQHHQKIGLAGAIICAITLGFFAG